MTSATSAQLVEVVVRVDAEHEEHAVGVLLELSPAGFRHDAIAMPDGTHIAEFGIFGGASELSTIGTYLMRAGVPLLSIDSTPVAADWSERWKEFHKPVIIGELWIGPPWDIAEVPAGVKPVVIEPGQGFGTGAHPTTRLVLSLLGEQARSSVLDVGCGSGVLAVAAAVLGFGPIIAIDNDPAAIDSTHDNLARNDLRGIDVRLVDARAESLPAADLVLANLTLEPLQVIAPRVTAPRVIASGLLRSQVDAAVAAFEEAGYVLRDRRDRDGWAAIVLDHADPERVMRHSTVI